ncbi:hypothetical protein DPMN_139318 [Dreissena polymorpha]|uniref:Uncharacterized protein n=1 Tax=Dreissena polymorpha TaxID=45954 RepID=A0A9D4JI13_DREPO|nr:hypothetical protein DPMN_139318 [Dreissena polymorpha]
MKEERQKGIIAMRVRIRVCLKMNRRDRKRNHKMRHIEVIDADTNNMKDIGLPQPKLRSVIERCGVKNKDRKEVCYTKYCEFTERNGGKRKVREEKWCEKIRKRKTSGYHDQYQMMVGS